MFDSVLNSPLNFGIIFLRPSAQIPIKIRKSIWSNSAFLVKFDKTLIAKYEKRGKYLPIFHKATCNNYFIVKCLLKSNVLGIVLLTNCIELAWYNLLLTWYKNTEAKTANTVKFPGYILYFGTALYFHISV